MLLNVVTAENAAEWRQRLDGLTVAQIQEVLDSSKRSGDGDGKGAGKGKENATTRKGFSLFSGQMANVEAALERAKEMSNSDKEGNCLDLVCTEFLSLHTTNRDMAAYFQSIERTHGVLLVAIDPKANDFVYGKETVQKLAEMAHDAGELDDEELAEVSEELAEDDA